MTKRISQEERERRGLYEYGSGQKLDLRLLRDRNIVNGCWEYSGKLAGHGYGTIRYRGKFMYRHRAAYEIWVGSIPEGYQIDHLCRNRACFNPDHLEAVTQKENIRRGHAPAMLAHLSRKCQKGHEIFGDNIRYVRTRNQQVCRKCDLENQRLRNLRKKELKNDFHL